MFSISLAMTACRGLTTIYDISVIRFLAKNKEVSLYKVEWTIFVDVNGIYLNRRAKRNCIDMIDQKYIFLSNITRKQIVLGYQNHIATNRDQAHERRRSTELRFIRTNVTSLILWDFRKVDHYECYGEFNYSHKHNISQTNDKSKFDWMHLHSVIFYKCKAKAKSKMQCTETISIQRQHIKCSNLEYKHTQRSNE